MGREFWWCGRGGDIKTKRKGSRNEHRARRILESDGWHVTRAAGSLGIFDLVAISFRGIRLIQVKTNRNVSKQEREAIELFDGLPLNGTKEIWVFHDYERDGPKIIEIPTL